MTDSDDQPQRPLLRIVRGTPDEHELAALTAVVAGMAAGAAEPEPPQQHSRWADPHGRLRRPLHPGPGAWRGSGLPG